jgi:hypothetical protein
MCSVRALLTILFGQQQKSLVIQINFNRFIYIFAQILTIDLSYDFIFYTQYISQSITHLFSLQTLVFFSTNYELTTTCEDDTIYGYGSSASSSRPSIAPLKSEIAYWCWPSANIHTKINIICETMKKKTDKTLSQKLCEVQKTTNHTP